MKPSPMPSMAWGPPSASRQDRTLLGLHGVDFRVRVLLLQVLADAGDGAAAALGGHEHVHLAAGLLPDLRPGGLVVGCDVVPVGELAGLPVAVRLGALQLLDLLQTQVHVALGPGGEHQLGAVGAHGGLALLTHALGHHHHHRVAAHRADHGKWRYRCCR